MVVGAHGGEHFLLEGGFDGPTNEPRRATWPGGPDGTEERLVVLCYCPAWRNPPHRLPAVICWFETQQEVTPFSISTRSGTDPIRFPTVLRLGLDQN